MDQEAFQGGHKLSHAKPTDPKEFFKVVEKAAYFEKEVKFLQMANENEMWRPLVPRFIRIQEDGETHIEVLENFLCDTRQPVIADFKLGTQSWEPGASAEKIADMDSKDSQTTTKSLGMRVTSAQLPQGNGPDAGYLPAGRVAVKNGLDINDWRAGRDSADVKRILSTYLRTKELQEQFLNKLQPVVQVFETQTSYQFIGLSLFVWYSDNAESEGPSGLDMRLIDFAHVLDDQDKIDEGVLRGLNSLKEMVTEIYHS